jgi:hypothetical protein
MKENRKDPDVYGMLKASVNFNIHSVSCQRQGILSRCKENEFFFSKLQHYILEPHSSHMANVKNSSHIRNRLHKGVAFMLPFWE